MSTRRTSNWLLLLFCCVKYNDVFICRHPPGSQEERWQLQIVAKGRVTCPKCKSVSRKTVEGLKKHMENCRLVSTNTESEFKVYTCKS